MLVTRQSLYMIHPLATPTDVADAYTVHRVVLDPYPPEEPQTIVPEVEPEDDAAPPPGPSPAHE